MEHINNHYNKKLKPFAREHRGNSTKAEVRLWCELLRNKQMKGYQFLRQRSIAAFIADFMCFRLKLIIEVDGGSHIGNEKNDLLRDEYLEELGYTTLRFLNEEVMEDIDGVRSKIEAYIERFEGTS